MDRIEGRAVERPDHRSGGVRKPHRRAEVIGVDRIGLGRLCSGVDGYIDQRQG